MVTVRVCSKLKKLKVKIGCFYKKKKKERKRSREEFSICGRFNKTIIALAIVGYEMMIANLELCAYLAIYHLTSIAHSWNNCQVYLACIEWSIFFERFICFERSNAMTSAWAAEKFSHC